MFLQNGQRGGMEWSEIKNPYEFISWIIAKINILLSGLSAKQRDEVIAELSEITDNGTKNVTKYPRIYHFTNRRSAHVMHGVINKHLKDISKKYN